MDPSHAARRYMLVAFALMLTVVAPAAAFAEDTGPTAQSIWLQTNIQRYNNGLPILKHNALLDSVAWRKMRDLFNRQYFAHESPTGQDVADLAQEAGYDYITIGENLALGNFASGKEVVDAWMGSAGHRKNILSKGYSEIGIAAGKGLYEGRQTWILVQSFGLPQSSCPATDTALRADIERLQQSVNMLKTIVLLRKERLSERGLTRNEYNARVTSYNLAVELYNGRAEELRTLASQYNTGVDAHNVCVRSRTGSA